jgi:hypothetical protein
MLAYDPERVVFQIKHGNEGSASEQHRGMDMGVPESTIISIVDDDESVRGAIKSLLKSDGAARSS